MRSVLLALLVVLGMISPTRAEMSCLLVLDLSSGNAVVEEGDGCDERIGPASTFKFPLAIMGFDAGVLRGPDAPEWPYRESYAALRSADRAATTPARWLQHSVLWFSRRLVEEMGGERLATYVRDFDYGNADISGDPGAANGLTHSWLNSSLQISPREQAAFVRRFVSGALPVAGAAIEATARAMPVFTSGKWTLRGKTGTGYIKEADGKRGNRQFGWFVGWATDGDRIVVFARLDQNSKSGGSALGPWVRDQVVSEWPSLLAK